MTYISIIKCDNTECNTKNDLTDPMGPTYHELNIGGSDFEMSFGQRTVHFCSLKCLQEWLTELIELSDKP